MHIDELSKDRLFVHDYHECQLAMKLSERFLAEIQQKMVRKRISKLWEDTSGAQDPLLDMLLAADALLNTMIANGPPGIAPHYYTGYDNSDRHVVLWIMSQEGVTYLPI